MSGVNKVIILGYVGKDPDARKTQSGISITNISVATSDSWKDKQTGDKKENTEWHRIVFYDKLADVVGEYVKKGTRIYVEGKIKTRKWKDESGQDRYMTEIHGFSMQLLTQQNEIEKDNDSENAPDMQDDDIGF